jgi:misacylated tRNA(Ala) deacylase
MDTPPTLRLYLQDNQAFQASARILAIQENAIALDQTCFYPGGGGQPPDEGTLTLASGEILQITSTHVDGAGIIWHVCSTVPSASLVDHTVRLALNRDRRLVLMRYHTVLHVLNSITLQAYDGWITGVQIGVEHSRIDFKLDAISPALCAELESRVNAVLTEDHPIKSYTISEAEFTHRPDLLRTLDARPPITNGQVRVVEIEGFDAQACGGTHVRSTLDVGRFSIFRTENKGRQNKRLYVRITP